MERTHFLVATAVAAALALPWPGLADSARMERFRTKGAAVPEAPPAIARASSTLAARASSVTEAPTGFDNRTNGFLAAGTAIRFDQ